MQLMTVVKQTIRNISLMITKELGYIPTHKRDIPYIYEIQDTHKIFSFKKIKQIRNQSALIQIITGVHKI